MPPAKRTRVIIAGAGLAGLTAARYLERAGAEVTILDARDRTGGRVFTMREGFEDAQHGELGADLIEAEQTLVIGLAKALGLETERILRNGWGFYGGTRKAASSRNAPDTFERAAEELRPEIEAFKAAGCRWDSAVGQRLGGQSVADWMTRRRLDAQLSAALRGLRGFYLADPEDLSLLPLVDQFAEGEMPGASRMYRIREGNDALANGLARELKGRVHLKAPILAVRQRGRTLSVTVGGDRRQQLRADYLICTMPATTLRRVTFEPALPDEQVEAFATLRYGPATKVLLQFEKRFWKQLTGPSAYGSDRPTGAAWDANEQQSRTPGILTLLAGGRASRELRDIIDSGGWKALVRRLGWLGRPTGLIAAASYTWEHDPWSRGGYAVFSPRFDPSLRAWLARPAGRILFAGEHTSLKWQGFMNGAVESGRRAAVEAAFLAGLPYERLTEEP
jgi:monoamine oxidase